MIEKGGKWPDVPDLRPEADRKDLLRTMSLTGKAVDKVRSRIGPSAFQFAGCAL